MKSDDIKKYFKNDRFAEFIGIELVDVARGYAKTKLTIRQEHLNGLNIGHGGAVFTLADLAFAAACNSYGTIAMAINIHISFIKAVKLGTTLIAEAKEVSLNPKLGIYAVTVTDETGDIIATFEGLAYRKKDKIPDE